MTTTTATVDPTATSTTTPKKKRNKRKLPVRNIIDAELVTIDTKKSSNSNTNAQQREMDDLLLSSQRDRTILSDLWNNTITTGRPSNSDKPRVIIGTPTHKKVKQPSTDPDTTDKTTASAAVEEKKALTSSSIKKKDILKEKLKKELQNKKSESVLDLSGHTIIPLTLQKDISSKVAKEKATMKSRKTQQQQQKEEKDYHDDAPSYDYDDYDTTALLNNNTTNDTTTTSSNTTNDTSTKHSNKDVKVDSSNIMDHDIQAVVEEEEEEGQKDKQVNEETKPAEAHVEEEKEKVEKADDSDCVASQKVETAAQTEKVDNVNEAIEEQAVDIVDKETVDKLFNTDSDKEQKSSSDEKKELHESTATITETCSIQPNVQPGIVTLEEAKQNLQECEQNIEIPTKAPPICNNLTINKVHKAQEQDDDDGEEEEEEEELSWMKQKDDENDVNQAQDDVYQNIFNLMSKKPSVTTKKRKAEQIESGSLSKRLKMLRASKRLDWLENAADNNTNNNIKIQKKERAKIQTRKDRLQDKLEQPYIIKKRIKSVWFVQ